MAGIGHKHAITAGQAEISGQRGTLVAAFFLDDLDQQHLTALDHVLDLVAAAQRQSARAQFVGFLGLAAILAATAAATALSAIAFAFVFGAFAVFGPGVVAFAVIAAFDHAAFDRGNAAGSGIVDFGYAIAIVEGIAGKTVFVEVVVFIFVGGAQRGFGFGMARFFGEQCLAVFLGNLVIVGMNFAERKEAVAIAAKVDKCGLQRGFDPGYLGKVDITLDLLVIGRFEIEFFNSVAFEHRHPGFFLVARID